MKTKFFKTGFIFIVAVIALLGTTSAVSADYKSMQGIQSTDTVFDFRISDPATALAHLGLIHDMKSDPNLVINDSQPDIVLVFIGPSVKLISTDRSDFDQQDRETLNKLADKITSMSQDGIKFEVCMVAAHSANVDPDTILPEINEVYNGWISLIGYQNNGYALIANF